MPAKFPALTRRHLLASAAAVGALAAVPLAAPGVFAAAHDRPLALPQLDEGRVENGVRIFDLAIRGGQTEFFQGRPADTIGINADYLGPVLRMRTGETVRMNVTNDLGVTTTLHWHGLELPAWCDGGPHQPIDPGQTWSPEFPMRQRAGTYWYHGHHMGHTAEHVWYGLAGVIRVEDAEADALNLPATYGVDDFPVVLQDRWFTRNGQLNYAPRMPDVMMGMSGDVALANGTPQAFVDVPAGLVRLRLLNGANASFYDIGFSDGAAFWQIATDGGLLAAPVQRDRVLLAPGERAEILVDMADRTTRELIADLVPIGGGMMGRMMGSAGGTLRFLQLRPTGAATGGQVPARLTSLAKPDPTTALRTRDFELNMGGMGMGMGMGGGGFTINGASMDDTRIDETVRMGEPEIWRIRNPSPMAHPFHIHNVQFRIVDRNGRAPDPGEDGFKDTVVVNSGETVRVLLTFTENADPEGPYMYHCHILEHEDAGMMGQFVVV